MAGREGGALEVENASCRQEELKWTVTVKARAQLKGRRGGGQKLRERDEWWREGRFRAVDLGTRQITAPILSGRKTGTFPIQRQYV